MRFGTLIMGVLTAASLFGCDKLRGGDADGGTSTSAATSSGCGSDWVDPGKEFCVKLPAGYTVGQPEKASELYSQIQHFHGPAAGFDITVGFSSSSFKTFDDQLKSDEAFYPKIAKVEASGATAGGGMWWEYDQKGYKGFVSDTKSGTNKVIGCSLNGSTRAPEIMEACKSVRAYAK